MSENEYKESGIGKIIICVQKCRHSKENKRSRGCAIGRM